MMKNTLAYIFLFLSLVSCREKETGNLYSVVPLPQNIQMTSGRGFTLNQHTVILYPKDDLSLKRNAEFLVEYLSQPMDGALDISGYAGEELKPNNSIVLQIDPSIENDEGYRIHVSEQGVTIQGKTPNGIFYGIQTLRKSILPGTGESSPSLAAAQIDDAPRFPYRGMHLDVSRHFFGVDFIKKYIDLLALHNMNVFHWHLTDDQGWRIEIKKYPKLTATGGFRKGTVVGYLGSGKNDGIRYGGFYTQEEIEEVVSYAQERYVTIIPEIDFPGHVSAALAAYPELGCTGGPYEVATDWGVFNDVLCVGNEKVFQFLEDVLTEVVGLFPSRYIHIGGDEAPRLRWQSCPRCQARIKEEQLRPEAGHTPEDCLQTYCTRRIGEFLKSKGKVMIGWDEITRGELPPDAVVMSWQGVKGGIKAAGLGHNVIMTPNTHCYFDFYQTPNSKDEPLAIGGCLPVEKVYQFDPASGLDADAAKYVLGVQANVWTEYMPNSEQVEYMILPRMAALAEVQWTQPDHKDFDSFQQRLVRLISVYQQHGYHYARHIYSINAQWSTDAEQKRKLLTLKTIDNAPIHYTLDGSEPSEHSARYTAPLIIDKAVDICARTFRTDNENMYFRKKIAFNKATLCKAKFINSQPVDNYTFKGISTLVDGIEGSDNFSSGEWLGFQENQVQICIDLGTQEEVERISFNAMTFMDAWIMGPSGAEVYGSLDGKNFKLLSKEKYPDEKDTKARYIKTYHFSLSPTALRYIKLSIGKSPDLPVGHSAHGNSPFLFVDEIKVN